MYTRHLAPVLIALLLLAGARQATAAPELRALMSRDGLAFLLDQVGLELAGERQLEDIEDDLFKCPIIGGTARARVSDIRFEVGIDAVSPIPQDDRLTITFYLNLAGSAQLSALNLLCIGGDLGCDASFALKDVPVRLDLVPSVEDGKVRLLDSKLSIDLGAHHLDLDIAECGLVGEIGELAYDIVGQNLVGLLRPELEQLAREQLLTQVEELLGGLGQLSGEAANLSIEGSITDVPVSQQGLGVDVAIEMTPASAPPCEIAGEAPAPASSEVPPRLAFQGEHLGLALSAELLQNAVVAAWQAGLFCLTGDQTGGVPQLGGALELDLPNPPRVELVPGEAARFRLVLPQLSLTLSQVTAQLDLGVELALGVDPTSAVLLSEPVVEIDALEVSGNSELLDFEKLIRGLLPNLIGGLLRDQVLLPRVFEFDQQALADYQVYVARAQTTSRHILLYAKLGKRPEHDDVAPETDLVEVPGDWNAAKVDIVALGSDDQTPTALLRYSWRVDQGSWSEPELSTRFATLLASGRRTVEVVAVDLNGNRDPSPASVTFDVDATAPELTITQAPPDEVTAAGVSEQGFSVGYSVSDDQTPADQIVVHVVYARQLPADEGPTLSVIEDELTGGTSLELFPLGLGTHTLSLIAEDAVGNRSAPKQLLFDVVAAVDEIEDKTTTPDKSGCCAISRQPLDGPPASGCLVALLFAWHLVTRRRRPSRKRQA